MLPRPPGGSSMISPTAPIRRSPPHFHILAHVPTSPPRVLSVTRFKRLRLMLPVAAIALAAAIGAFRHAAHRGVLEKLASARPARTFAARLSVPVEYHRCTVLPEDTSQSVPRESCGRAAGEVLSIDGLDAAGQSSDPDSLQASALAGLIGAGKTGSALDTVIARLRRALPLSEHPTSVLVDLSGAHLVRAQRMQNAQDLMVALDYAKEALATDSSNPAALFNAALAMQTYGLIDQAALAWGAYLRADSSSEWATEARGRQRQLRHTPQLVRPSAHSSEQEIRAFAEHHPQEARVLGLDTVLGEWGTAWLAGDTAKAAKLLEFAERLGTAVLERRGGDRSLASAVKSIRDQANDRAASRKLARGHRAFAAAMELYGSTRHTEAGDSFKVAAGVGSLSPVLAYSAETFQTATLVYAGRNSEADSLFQALLTNIDTLWYPALAAEAWVRKGTGLTRKKRYAEALQPFETATRLFRRAGEEENTGYAIESTGDAACGQRDTITAYNALHRGLTLLRGYPKSIWRVNTLYMLANCALEDGMPLAAKVALEEATTVAMRLPNSPTAVDALLARARSSAAAGDTVSAAKDVTSAEMLLDTMRVDTAARKHLEATVRYSRAVVVNQHASLPQLDSAVAYFRAASEPVWLLPTVLRRAEMRIETHDQSGAAADLDSATLLIRKLSQDSPDASSREAVMEHARDSFDKLVMLHVGIGHARDALLTLERGRVSFAPGATVAAPAGELAAPPGQVAVEYALIGDTLLTWTVRGNVVHMLVDTLDRKTFLRTVSRLGARLEAGGRGVRADAERSRTAARAPGALFRPDLAYLYDVLVRPVENRLGDTATTLVILPDGEVAGAPFAALWDSRRGRYLMEDHALRFAASLHDAAHAAPARDSARPVLLVADPAFDTVHNPELERLPGARAEVDSLLTLYPGAMVLEDSDATRDSLFHEAARAGMIHYAGHAVFDDARPEQSALVLAGADTTGRLTAAAVNRLKLDGVRLVVLSACRTVRTREGRSGGFSGFSGALLTAGAGGVVGSLWLVDDSLAQPFMLEFHRAYGSKDPAAALRQAQLRMLTSGNARLSSPAAWAGFRYIGR